MSIKADCHLHSSFSGDSQAPMPEMIDKGLALGLETMCFTEHNDFDYPRTEEGPGTIFLLNLLRGRSHPGLFCRDTGESEMP